MHLLNRFALPSICDLRAAILRVLPSARRGVETELSFMLRKVWIPEEGVEEEDHEVFKSMVSMASYSALMGDEGAECVGIVCSICFHFLVALISIKALSGMGLDFSEY